MGRKTKVYKSGYGYHFDSITRACGHVETDINIKNISNAYEPSVREWEKNKDCKECAHAKHQIIRDRNEKAIGYARGIMEKAGFSNCGYSECNEGKAVEVTVWINVPQ